MSVNHQTGLLGPPKSCVIGSAWRRVLAFAADAIVLNTCGLVLGIAFFAGLSRSGPWARVIGFCIGLAYFATLESRAGGGQTLGKRLFRLRLVGHTGCPFSWGYTASRYSIFATPYFLLVGPRFPVENSSAIVGFSLIFVTFGLGFSTLYLLAFNRRTRQGVHDLAVGSFVVNSATSGSPDAGPIRPAHLWAVGGIVTIIGLTALLVAIGAESNRREGYVSQKSKDEQLIQRISGVRSADVMLWRPHPDGGAFRELLLRDKPATIIIQYAGDPVSRQAAANQAAGIVLKCDPRAQKGSLIRILVGQSYDLGISSGNNYQSFTRTPAQWQERAAYASNNCTP